MKKIITKKNTLSGLGVLFVIVFCWHGYLKPLPTDLNFASDVYTVPADGIKFIKDSTYLDANGAIQSDQEIFDTILDLIDSAESYILIDMFFFSDFLGTETEAYRYLAGELTQALIAKKKSQPDATIQVISDGINTIYGGHNSTYFENLRSHNIPVIETNLKPLRDSNPTYSSLWRIFAQWFPVNPNRGVLPNALDAHKPKVSISSYLSAFNYKANHRKIMIADQGNKLVTLITSANPHDGSSRHSNVAVLIEDFLWKAVLRSEQAVAKISKHTLALPTASQVQDKNGSVSIQLITEKKIKQQIVEKLDQMESGDAMDMLMFFLSDRDIVRALKSAHKRGVAMRIILDPNKDSFGREKNGLPNRQVALELKSKGIDIRWCNTQGEQCHSKLIIFHHKDQKSMTLGSANLTRRNIDNYNLESNVLLTSATPFPAFATAQEFFDSLWDNQDGNQHTLPYSAYQDENWFQFAHYWIKEVTGLSRF